MSILNWGKDKIKNGKTSILKSKIKQATNKKLGLSGELDNVIDKVASKIIDKIGVDNIIKGHKIIGKLKNN